MKIGKEDFYKLKQLDRIEYRQRLNNLEKDKIEVGIISFLDKMFIIIGFIFLIAINMFQINKDSAIKILSIVPILFDIIIIITVILFILSIHFNYKFKKQIDELNKEYFEYEVKK